MPSPWRRYTLVQPIRASAVQFHLPTLAGWHIPSSANSSALPVQAAKSDTGPSSKPRLETSGSHSLVPRLLRGLDQRFPPLQEAAFKKDLEPKVVLAGAVASALFLLLLGPNLILVATDVNNPDLPLTFASGDPRTWAAITKILSGLLGVANLVLCCLRLRLGVLASWNWELQVLTTATLAMVCSAFNSRRWSLLFGLRPEEVLPYRFSGDECNEMLTLDAFTTGLCIFIPIRFCALWVAPVSGYIVHLSMQASLGSDQSSWHNAVLLIGLAFLSLMGAFSNERTARQRFLAVIDVKVQEGRLSAQYLAMSRILARFCDCVLELDAEFRFCGSHQSFAAIVFSSANKSLDGGSFLDHLAAGQRTFAELLSEHTPVDQVSDMLPLLLKDSQGREFAAQAYCTCYEDRKGRHYFVGITETQERFPQEAYLAPLLDFNPVRSSVRRPSIQSESSGSYVEEPQELPEKEEISFVFIDDTEFSLISCSPGFTALGGPLSQEQPLKQWMRPQELQRFSNWAQEVGNMFRQHQTFKDVILRPPHTEQADVEYVVELCLSFLQMTDDSEVAFQVSVEEIRQRRRYRKKNRSRKGRDRRGPLTSADMDVEGNLVPARL